MALDIDRLLSEIYGGDATAHELETETLEFKQDKPSIDDTVKDVADAVLCFANNAGGTVIVGVANDVRGPAAFVGSRLVPDLTRKRIYELTRPPLVIDCAAREIDGRSILVLRVLESPDIHSDPQGRAPRRIGTDCVPMTPDEQTRLREERKGVDWSGSVSERSMREVSPEAIAIARRRLGTFTDPRRELVALSDEDLLRALGVLSADNALLRAGEILFCDQSSATGFGVTYQYRLTPGGEPSSIERLPGPLVHAFERVLELIVARRNLTPLTLPDGQQIHIEDFPDLAVREAMANAVIHRDYHLTGSVVVEHSPEVFVVMSPGPLVSGVTPENILTHPSKPRNPLLARVARMLGLAEEVGRGVDRMYREMIRSGRDVPKIISSVDNVRVTLVGGAPDNQIARYVAQLPQREREDTDAMLILLALCTRRTVSAEQLAPVVQKTAEEAQAVLRRLAGEATGMLEPTRESARRSQPNYRLRGEALKLLGSAVPYQRRTTDEIDRKVIEHVREYGKVTNRTVRNLLDVGVHRAAAIVGDLAKREILVKTSEAQRGPSVEYGAGPRFPHAKPRQRREKGQEPLF
ncbi:MAG: putative DNA binding domain-containing protein [Actinobacteria bacterium]|nr:putative DNA binding domain-containing protein [Actinomycetota bacterium]